MSDIKHDQKRASDANKTLCTVPSYHETLRDVLKQWSQAKSGSKQAIQKGEIRTSDEAPSATFSHEAAPQLDLARFSRAQQLSETGERIISERPDRAHPLLKRGKLTDPWTGIPTTKGNVISIDPDTLEQLAAEHRALESAYTHRADLALPERLRTAMRIPDSDWLPEWRDLTATQRRKHEQSGYEMAIALALLQRANPEVHQSLIESSTLLQRLNDGALKPYLSGLSVEYQKKFVVSQKDIAWAWRNRLENGKAARAHVPDGDRDLYFRTQIGLGMLEYLLPTGKETLQYMRTYGKQMAASPFRRTEIQEEHMHEYLTGVPLQNGEVLCGTPELFVHFAREHHELWRYTRELSWLLPDTDMHQPPREVHAPWHELSISNQNRDILNVFGVCYMLGQFSEQDFQYLLQHAAPGNPYGFEFSAINRGKID